MITQFDYKSWILSAPFAKQFHPNQSETIAANLNWATDISYRDWETLAILNSKNIFCRLYYY